MNVNWCLDVLLLQGRTDHLFSHTKLSCPFLRKVTIQARVGGELDSTSAPRIWWGLQGQLPRGLGMRSVTGHARLAVKGSLIYLVLNRLHSLSASLLSSHCYRNSVF